MKWADIRHYLTWFWGLCLFSLCFSHQVSSITLVLLALVVFIAQSAKDKPRIRFDLRSTGMLGLVVLFILHLAAFWYYPEKESGWFAVEKKFSLLAIPILWTLSRLDWRKASEVFFLCFSLGLFCSGIIMLGHSVWSVYETGELKWLFYHNLTYPLPISAIYYSWYLVIALFWPLNEMKMLTPKKVIAMRVFFVLLLLMAASKLLVVLAIILGLVRLLDTHTRKKIKAKHAFLLAVAIGLSYPVISRFMELRSPHLELVTQDHFTYDSPFNGLNLRLIQWRFGLEILSDQRAWITGVGPVYKQALLNAKYEAYGMYTGNPELGDSGYKQYNFHNQYMETLVSNGLVGLCCLLFIIFALIVPRHTNQPGLFSSLMVICFTFMLTESMLERRQGVVLFAFLTCAALKPDATTPIESAYE